MAELVLFTTGGTIASSSQGSGGATPTLTGQDLLEGVTVPEGMQVRVRPFAQMPSGHLSLQQLLELLRAVEEELAREDTVGAVVTHGTDTLEETAFLAYLTLSSPKPVVFTGSMRTASQSGYDGKRNLQDALWAAAAPQCRGLGPLVVFNEEIHSARWVTKTHTQKLETFASPFAGPLGVVTEAGVFLHRRPAAPPRTFPAKLAEPVDIIMMSVGCGSGLLEASLQRGVKGLVIAGYGGGRVHPDCLGPMERAISAGIPVVVTTRTWGGRLEDPYGYPGAHADLRARGCLFAHDLSAPKARLKLMVALGNGLSTGEMRAWFEEEWS